MSTDHTAQRAGLLAPVVAQRIGIKGPGALAWLSGLGLPVPEAPNRIVHWQAGDGLGAGRCLRQGNSEFLVELDEPGRALPDASGAPGVWALLRSDACLRLDAARWPALLAPLCAFDFRQLQSQQDLVVMTLAAGIGVTLARDPAAAPDAPAALRLWCDPGFAPYLQQCLHTLADSAPEAPGDPR